MLVLIVLPCRKSCRFFFAHCVKSRCVLRTRMSQKELLIVGFTKANKRSFNDSWLKWTNIWTTYLPMSPKGQLISECLFDLLNFPKNTEKFDKFLPKNLKSGQINKIKALFYNSMIYIWVYGLLNVLLYLYFMIWPLFCF